MSEESYQGGGGKGSGKGVPCRYGSRCNRSDCRFVHPSSSRDAPTPPAADGSAGSAQQSAAPGAEQVLQTLEVAADIYNQLLNGMLYHLNRHLRRYGLQGRLHRNSNHVELLSLGSEVEVLQEEVEVEIQTELLRLTSLKQELTERIPILQDLVKRLIGPHGQTSRMLSRDLGVEIYVQNSPQQSDRDAVVEMTGVPALLDQALSVVEQHLISFVQTSPHHAALDLQLAAEMREVVHVFVDNSNISIGCQFLPNGTRDFTQRLSIPKFAQAVRGVRQVGRQVVVGSKPPRTHAIWQHWVNAGYEVLVEWRDPETNREQFVDARLVAEAMMHVDNIDRLQQQGHSRGRRQVLALCTGDGNLEGQASGTAGANFINLAQFVARRGWKVEVWCWHSTCNSAYRRLAENQDLQVKLCFLDGLRSKITMVSRPAAPEEEDLCQKCQVNVPTHAFQPCNHKILCADCVVEVLPHLGRPPIGWCFICREPWTSIVAAPARPNL